MRRVSIGILLILAAALHAGEVRPVTENAKWVIHVDCQKILGSELGPFIRQVAQKPEPAAGLAQIEVVFGIKLLSDIHQITIFGEEASEEKTVLAVQGHFDLKKLTALIEKSPQYTTSNYSGRVIHTWHDGEKNKNPYACLAAENLLLVGNTEAMICRVLDTLDGKAPAAVFGADVATADSLAYFAVRDLQSLQGADPKAAILQKVTELRAHADAKEHQFGVSVEAKAVNEAAAKNVKSVLDGLRAMAALNAQENETLAAIADKVSVQGDGLVVRVSLSVAADTATAWLDAQLKQAGNGAKPNVLATPAGQ